MFYIVSDIDSCWAYLDRKFTCCWFLSLNASLQSEPLQICLALKQSEWTEQLYEVGLFVFFGGLLLYSHHQRLDLQCAFTHLPDHTWAVGPSSTMSPSAPSVPASCCRPHQVTGAPPPASTACCCCHACAPGPLNTDITWTTCTATNNVSSGYAKNVIWLWWLWQNILK